MKNKESFTPGPWEVAGGTNKKGELYVWRKARPGIIDCGAIATILHHYPAELPANARLIAAAPELLAALESLAKIATDSTKDIPAFEGAEALDKAVDTARAAIAIAKAKGE